MKDMLGEYLCFIESISRHGIDCRELFGQSQIAHYGAGPFVVLGFFIALGILIDLVIFIYRKLPFAFSTTRPFVRRRVG